MRGAEFEIGPNCESPVICAKLGKCSSAWEITKHISNIKDGYPGATKDVLQWMINTRKCENPQVAEAITAAQQLLKP